MKSITRILGLTALLLMSAAGILAQKAVFTTNSGLTLGFGVGESRQNADLLNSTGAGFDVILGSQLYKEDGAFLSADWKFRFLAGENSAFDHRINTDNTYSNVHYSFFTYDLELGLTLNRLRERTRIVVSGFAGAGITHGRTFTDRYDMTGSLYDFSMIDPNRDSKLIYNDLLALSDGDFETRLNNRAALLPTLGFFLGYQFTPSFSLGIEYKTNFYLSEQNSLIGMNLDSRPIPGSGIDRNSYTGLKFGWVLRGGGQARNIPDYTPEVNTGYTGTNVVTNTQNQLNQTTTNVTRVPVPLPTVQFTDPSVKLAQSAYDSYVLKAVVNHIEGAYYLSFYQNGSPNYSFAYDASTKLFTADVRLLEGENTFTLRAVNKTGSAEDQVTIRLNGQRQVTLPVPEVEFTYPRTDRMTVSSEQIEVTARVAHVEYGEDIHLTRNGISIPFDFNPATGTVRAGLVLRTGENNLLIRVSNEAGSDQDQAEIYLSYPERMLPPTVYFVNPGRPETVREQRYQLVAQTQNVATRNDVILKVNGRPVGFSFNQNGEVIADLYLSEGINNVELTAANLAGTVSERTSLTFSRMVERSYPPEISLITPAGTRYTTTEAFEEVRAAIRNVERREQITFTVNGQQSDFSFDGRSNELRARVSLHEGQNTVSIKAWNNSGSAAETLVLIRESRPCPQPEVRFLEPSQGQSGTAQRDLPVRAEVRNVSNSNQIRLSLNGTAVPFRFTGGQLNCSVVLAPGPNILELRAGNECGEDLATARIVYNAPVQPGPCTAPVISAGVSAVDRNDATHELYGSVSGVKNKTGITLTVDGRSDEGFQFIPGSGELSAKLRLAPGAHTIIVTARNECGSDNKTLNITASVPCKPPTVSAALTTVNRNDASHELHGSVSGVKNKTGITILVDGRPDEGFQFIPSTGELSAKFRLASGTHSIVVTVRNECGSDNKTLSVAASAPCISPKVNASVTAVDRGDATHELRGSVSGIDNKADIAVLVDGRPDAGFQFIPSTGELSAKFRLAPGTHSIVITAHNNCGSDNKTLSVSASAPCTPPKVNASVNAVDRSDASHELRGSVSGIANKADIAVLVDGRPDAGFQFIPSTGELSAKFRLAPGTHSIVVTVRNECGSDNKTLSVSASAPCTSPKVNASLTAVDRSDATHELRGTVSGIDNKTGITVLVDGRSDAGFQFIPSTGELSAKFRLAPGTHSIVVTVRNDCGTDNRSMSVSVAAPCSSPTVNTSVAEVSSSDATHELRGSVSGIDNKTGITVMVDGRPDAGFQFVPSTGALSAKFKLASGNHSIVVTVRNECGSDSRTHSVSVQEEACGPRINPGNAAWQFCLVTPSRSYTRDDLRNPNFSYSGPARSLYFMPIAGGGPAMVNGRPYALRPGQYYLFTGNLNVTVSTKNPGSMGQWSVCIRADREPVSGNGNNRPKSPCEENEPQQGQGTPGTQGHGRN